MSWDATSHLFAAFLYLNLQRLLQLWQPPQWSEWTGTTGQSPSLWLQEGGRGQRQWWRCFRWFLQPCDELQNPPVRQQHKHLWIISIHFVAARANQSTIYILHTERNLQLDLTKSFNVPQNKKKKRASQLLINIHTKDDSTINPQTNTTEKNT